MPISFGHVNIPEQGIILYINSVDYTRNYLNCEFKERDNEVKSFSIELLGITDTQRSIDLVEDVIVRLESQGVLIFKGIVERVDYQTGDTVIITGFGSGESYLKRQLADRTASSSVDSAINRPIYEDVSLQTIISEQMATVSGVTIDSVDNGAELGVGTYRGDYITVLEMIANPIANRSGKWWFTHGNLTPFNQNIFHASQFRGSASPVKVFRLSGTEQNAEATKHEQDLESFGNDVVALGQGDGANQFRSRNFHATTIRSFLAGAIAATGNVLSLEDTSAFTTSGVVWVGMEKVHYASKSGNDLTSATRGGSELAIYNFNDGVGTTVHDELKLYNGGGFGTASWSLTTSKFGGGSIGGTTDVFSYNGVRLPSTVLVSKSVGSIEVWIYATSVASVRRVFSANVSGTLDTFIDAGNGSITARVNSGGSTLTSTTVPSANTWYHVALTWDGSKHRLYVNGVEEASASSALGTGAITHVSVGNNSTFDFSNFWRGFIDSLVIHKVAKYSFDTSNEPIASYEAYAHSKGVEVYDSSYGLNNPQSGSKVSDFGQKQLVFQDKQIFNQDALDRLSQTIRNDRDDIVTRIELIPSDPYSTLRDVNVDDTITIVDADSELNSDFTVHSRIFRSDEGYEQVILECSNARLTLTEELKITKQIANIESKFMQGSTTLITVNETENAQSGTVEPGPVDVFFEVPQEAVKINQVKLSYRNEPPRMWSGRTISGVSAVASPANSFLTNSQTGRTLSGVSTFGDLINYPALANAGIYAVTANVALTRTVGTGSMALRFRFENTTDGTFYPNSTGVLYNFVDSATTGAVGGPTLRWAIDAATASDLTGKNIRFQMAGESSNTFDFQAALYVDVLHSHLSEYDIISNDSSTGTTYTTSAINVYTTNDADGTPTWIDRTTEISGVLGRVLKAGNGQVESGLDLTSFYSSSGWKGVRLAVNGNSRHKVQLTAKVFVEAKNVS